jgi:hypothetical protein
VVSDDDFHYMAYVKNCDILCETEYVKIADLPGSENNASKRTSADTGRYTTEGGDRDESLRTTD